MLTPECWDSKKSHISLSNCLKKHILQWGLQKSLTLTPATIGWVNSCNHSRHQVFEPWLARQKGLLYMNEVISCLNSPILLNQKNELQSPHILEPAASSPASKECLMAFYWEQDTGKKYTQEGNWLRCLLWLDTLASTLFYFYSFDNHLHVQANDRKTQAVLL